MAFAASFSISVDSNPANIILTDTSSGSDPDLTTRTVYIYQVDGTLLTTPINWPISDSSITMPVLTQSIALNIQVVWTSTNPIPGSTYTYSQIYAFTGFAENYYYSLTQMQTSTPAIISDTFYYTNKLVLRVEIDSAVQAISLASDLYGSQNCLVRANYLITNGNYYF